MSSLLNTSKLSLWYSREDCNYIRQQSFDDMALVAKAFLSEETGSNSGNQSQPEVTQGRNESESEDDDILGFLRDDTYVNEFQADSVQSKLLKIDNEKIIFAQMIESRKCLQVSTASFWNSNKTK